MTTTFSSGDEILDVHLAAVRQNLGATLIAIPGDDFVELVADDPALAFRLGENIVVVGDLAHQLVMLVDDLLRFHIGQSHQLHRQDGIGLNLIDVEEFHQLRTCVLTPLAAAESA